MLGEVVTLEQEKHNQFYLSSLLLPSVPFLLASCSMGAPAFASQSIPSSRFREIASAAKKGCAAALLGVVYYSLAIDMINGLLLMNDDRPPCSC